MCDWGMAGREGVRVRSIEHTQPCANRRVPNDPNGGWVAVCVPVAESWVNRSTKKNTRGDVMDGGGKMGECIVHRASFRVSHLSRHQHPFEGGEGGEGGTS